MGQSPGLCRSLTPLILALTPFILLGFLRFFIASWASAPTSQQLHRAKKVEFVLISLTSILILGLTTFLIGALFIHLSHSLHN